MGFGKCTLESGKPNQLVAPSVKKCTAAHKQCAGTGLFQGRKAALISSSLAALSVMIFYPIARTVVSISRVSV